MLDSRRQLIIAEARTWLKTPFHHGQKLKGAGVDCLTFIVGVYENVGVVEPQRLPFYRPDFMQHQDEETYLNGLLEHGHEVVNPILADVAIFSWGRIYAHAGIVTSWPMMLHAHPVYGVIEMDGTQGKLRGRNVKFISAFEDAAA